MATVACGSSFFSTSAPTRSAPLPPTVWVVATRPAASSGDYPIDGWQRVIDVNLTSAFVIGREAARRMVARGSGKIINIASMLTFHGSPFAPGYAASKGAIGQLTKSLAAAWAPEVRGREMPIWA